MMRFSVNRINSCNTSRACTQTALLLGLCTLLLTPATAFADYWVYCIHNKIKVESRPPADVGRSYIASSICTFGSFRHSSDAQSFAQKNWGGEGKNCACR